MPLFTGHHYKVKDAEIIATGKVETWLSDSREKAIESALYTHRLHNRNALVSKMGVITCPSCGQIAIVIGGGLTPRAADGYATSQQAQLFTDGVLPSKARGATRRR